MTGSSWEEFRACLRAWKPQGLGAETCGLERYWGFWNSSGVPHNMKLRRHSDQNRHHAQILKLKKSLSHQNSIGENLFKISIISSEYWLILHPRGMEKKELKRAWKKQRGRATDGGGTVHLHKCKDWRKCWGVCSTYNPVCVCSCPSVSSNARPHFSVPPSCPSIINRASTSRKNSGPDNTTPPPTPQS